jgi:hypothetical protein
MRRSCLLLVLLVSLASAVPAQSQETRWSFEGFLGSAYNFPSPLWINQLDQDEVYVWARYDTRPLFDSPYYAWRISRWKETRAWEFELVHHKIYLSNEPDEVDDFNVSHGYNLLTLNRAWDYSRFILRFGTGLVISHPETEIRGRKFSQDQGLFGKGFYISGPTIQFAAGKRFYLWRKLFFALEAKITASYALIPIEGGTAHVPNAALHGLFGIGFDI